LAVALLKAKFKPEDVLAFAQNLRYVNEGIASSWPVLCWPDYPSSYDAMLRRNASR
jgi:hypothetical protein